MAKSLPLDSVQLANVLLMVDDRDGYFCDRILPRKTRQVFSPKILFSSPNP